jgi:hypothetical protein
MIIVGSRSKHVSDKKYFELKGYPYGRIRRLIFASGSIGIGIKTPSRFNKFSGYPVQNGECPYPQIHDSPLNSRAAYLEGVRLIPDYEQCPNPPLQIMRSGDMSIRYRFHRTGSKKELSPSLRHYPLCHPG